MKKILILGVKGMAGHMLYQYFTEKNIFDTYGIARDIAEDHKKLNLDVSNTASLKSVILENDFDYVVNCIGILNKDAEDRPAKAIWFNSYFPHFLEEITRDTHTKIIHISTDCVFSGKEGGYTETDFKNGFGYYAQSKALGEIDNKKDLTIRTSIIGPEINQNGIGLFHWFMSQSNDKELSGYKNAFWSGITTLELAKVVNEAITQNITGLIQIAPRQKINKFDLLQLFNDVYKGGHIKITPSTDYKVDKSLVSIRTDFNYVVPYYLNQLEEQKYWILNHNHMYSAYKILE